MVNKWYNSDTYYMSRGQRKRMRILRRRIRSACRVLIWVCMFMMLGIVGSVDVGEISLVEFFIYEVLTVGVLLASIVVNDMLSQ